MTNYATEMNGYAHSPEPAGPVRLILGLTMVIAGLYFGLFTTLPGHGLGLLSFIVSPFVFLTDKKRNF
jgi:predicted metal-binding membrane protein